MSQISSSFPSYYDEWDDSTNATEYYDIDDHDDNEPEDHDNEWIDMSGIPEDATFEEPELACMLQSLQKGKKGSGKGFWTGKKGWSKGESRDVLKAGKGGRPENYKQVRWKLQSDRLNRGWKDQPAHGTNKGRGRSQLAQMDDLLARTRCFTCGASLEGMPSEQRNNHKFLDFPQWHGLHQLLRCPSSKPVLR